jgi:hypothetical protein
MAQQIAKTSFFEFRESSERFYVDGYKFEKKSRSSSKFPPIFAGYKNLRNYLKKFEKAKSSALSISLWKARRGSSSWFLPGPILRIGHTERIQRERRRERWWEFEKLSLVFHFLVTFKHRGELRAYLFSCDLLLRSSSSESLINETSTSESERMNLFRSGPIVVSRGSEGIRFAPLSLSHYSLVQPVELRCI